LLKKEINPVITADIRFPLGLMLFQIYLKKSTKFFIFFYCYLLTNNLFFFKECIRQRKISNFLIKKYTYIQLLILFIEKFNLLLFLKQNFIDLYITEFLDKRN
tara:strand:- start:321 stop:629 length:309 start_codon:yes stop_codon:yes gene_type:complete